MLFRSWLTKKSTLTSAASSTENTTRLTDVPYVSQSIISGYLQTANANDQTNTRDDAGMPLVYGSCKLLDMLGYGSMIDSGNSGKAAITQKYLGLDGLSDGVNPLVYSVSQNVSALPFLAYQKVYFDFYSNPQWEKHLAYAYNVDYWTGGSSISLTTNMLKLRYADYPKDYFTGILPASQYGSVAALPTAYRSDSLMSCLFFAVSDSTFSVSTVISFAASASVSCFCASMVCHCIAIPTPVDVGSPTPAALPAPAALPPPPPPPPYSSAGLSPAFFKCSTWFVNLACK